MLYVRLGAIEEKLAMRVNAIAYNHTPNIAGEKEAVDRKEKLWPGVNR